jgi:hypothetical protein
MKLSSLQHPLRSAVQAGSREKVIVYKAKVQMDSAWVMLGFYFFAVLRGRRICFSVTCQAGHVLPFRKSWEVQLEHAENCR